MRTTYAPARAVPPATVSTRRRRSLHRGALRFHRDVCADGRRYHRVLLVALTMRDLDPEIARGSMRELMHSYRKVAGDRRYFWWPEFQKRGALHYHAVLVDPPFAQARDARRWFDRHWPHADINTWVDWRSAAWFRHDRANYVLKDIRKVHGKRYEQEYDRMPPKWRTFSTHRLTYSAEEHAPHEDRAYVVFERAGDQLARQAPLSVLVVALDHHEPAEGGCRLVRDDRLRRRRRTLRAPPRRGKVGSVLNHTAGSA